MLDIPGADRAVDDQPTAHQIELQIGDAGETPELALDLADLVGAVHAIHDENGRLSFALLDPVAGPSNCLRQLASRQSVRDVANAHLARDQVNVDVFYSLEFRERAADLVGTDGTIHAGHTKIALCNRNPRLRRRA